MGRIEASGEPVAVVLSPHLDDAALSLGGTIHRHTAAGRRVLVVTLFTSDGSEGDGSQSDGGGTEDLPPLARELHQRWGLDIDAMAVRRGEDEEACGVLGADHRHWGLADAVYRRGPGGEPLYPTFGALFGPPHAADAPLAGEIDRRLEALAAEPPGTATILAPLAVGGHADHRLVRDAARRLGDPRIEFYEDFPYARSPRALLRGLLSTLGPPWRWRSRLRPLGPTDLETKIEAVSRYRSQLATAFPSRDAMERRIRRSSRRGERFWRRSRRPPRSPAAAW